MAAGTTPRTPRLTASLGVRENALGRWLQAQRCELSHSHSLEYEWEQPSEPKVSRSARTHEPSGHLRGRPGRAGVSPTHPLTPSWRLTPDLGVSSPRPGSPCSPTGEQAQRRRPPGLEEARRGTRRPRTPAPCGSERGRRPAAGSLGPGRHRLRRPAILALWERCCQVLRTVPADWKPSARQNV